MTPPDSLSNRWSTPHSSRSMSDNNNFDSTNSNETDATNADANVVPQLQARELLRLLNKHGVKFVVIGGFVAELRNFDIGTTIDLDITPQRSEKNLDRLARFMDEINAGLLTTEIGGTWFPRWPVENWASYNTLHLTTGLGLLDVVFMPAGIANGYEELFDQSQIIDVDGLKVRVITESAWVRLKKITNRAKDNLHLQRYFEARGF